MDSFPTGCPPLSVRVARWVAYTNKPGPVIWNLSQGRLKPLSSPLLSSDVENKVADLEPAKQEWSHAWCHSNLIPL